MVRASIKSAVEAAVTQAGFESYDDHPVHGLVDQLSEEAPFVVHGAWQKSYEDGTVVQVHLEQNSAPDEPGSDTIITYPPVLVVENNKGGRVCVNVHDMEAFAAVLAGEVSF